MSTNKSIIKSVVIAIVILMYLFIGYYPIITPPMFNNGAILSTEEGLQFPATGIAYTESAPDWLIEAINSLSFDISLDVQPKSLDQTGPAWILKISVNNIIIVGQEGADLLVFLRSHDEIFNDTKKFVVRKVFDNLDRHILLISLKPGELAITVDGEKQLTAVLPDYAHNSRAHGYILTLGNKITYDHPWLGVIREAIFHANGRKLDFLKPGALELSGTEYQQFMFHRINLVPVYQQDYSIAQFRDWAVNFFGFIPLGLLWMLLYPGWSIRQITIICLGISFVIETTQILLPWRSPGITDLILNTLGGAAGAWAGVKFWKDSRKQGRDSTFT